MTTTVRTSSSVGAPEPSPVTPSRRDKLKLWLHEHRLSIAVLLPLLAIVGVISGWNFTGMPGTVNDDEGTYVAQAWAVLYQDHLAHYTYWYDHPPLGWLQIAGYAWLTNGFERSNYDVMMARELFLIANIVASALIYLIIRRLKFHRIIAVLAVLLFVVSPLAIYQHRMVFLDNLQVTWMLAAMAFAVSPRRSFLSAVGAGFCLAISTLSKETGGIVVPVIVMLLWYNLPKGYRKRNILMFLTTFISVSGFYVLFATLKGELIPGKGHVSLLHSLVWQMFGRDSTGTPFDKGSETYSLVMGWMGWDHWMLLAALAAIIPGLFFRRTRPFVVGYLIQLGLMFKGGYVPKAYAIVLIPFAALLLATVVGELCKRHEVMPVTNRASRRRNKWSLAREIVGFALTVILAGSFVVKGLPQWQTNLPILATRDSGDYLSQTRSWIKKNVPKDAHIVVDDNLWIDAKQDGYNRMDWLYKIDLDPAVRVNYPDADNSIDYIVIDRLPESLLKGLPLVHKAKAHSKVVFQVGNDDVQYTIYKVIHPDWYQRKPAPWSPPVK